MRLFLTLGLFSTLFVFSACSSGDDQPPLEGERLSIFDLQNDLLTTQNKENRHDILIPEIWANENWPQAGGYPNHSMQNLAINSDGLKKIWEADIGDGSTKQIPLTVQPIVAAGLVYTLDTRQKISAFNSESGQLVWRTDLEREDENVISGGLSFANNILYATSGYGEVVALDPRDGKILWRSKISAPSRAAPTVHQGRVFVTTLNNKAIALDSLTGKVLWEYESIGESTGLLGAASPAADDEFVINAFSSGEIIALRVQNGSQAWSDNLSNALYLNATAGLSDIRALPIIDNDIVLAVSFGGKMIAFDKRTGSRLWQLNISGSETPTVAGNTIYMISSDSNLIAINRQTGDIVWTRDLPKYEKPESKKGIIHWTGPIMAGDQLIAVSSSGNLLALSPKNGSVTGELNTRKDIRIAPIIAGGSLYLVSEDGRLLRYQ